jgi:hypothetical protein
MVTKAERKPLDYYLGLKYPVRYLELLSFPDKTRRVGSFQ